MGGVVPDPLHCVQCRFRRFRKAKGSKTMCYYRAKLIKDNTVSEL